MKTQLRRRRLNLRVETVRTLSARHLERVPGGYPERLEDIVMSVVPTCGCPPDTTW